MTAAAPTVDGAAGFRLERDEAVASLVVDREHAGNAIDRATGRALDDALRRLSDDPSLLALVVTSAGTRFFCTGGDLKDYRALDTGAAARETSLLMQRMLSRLEDLPAITIAAINGTALGGGLELALACDLRVIEEQVQLSLPQARLGVVPGWGGAERLVRTVGRSRAVRIMATAASITAEEAERTGLADLVVAPGEASAAAHRLAGEISANAPLAVRGVKEALALGDDVQAQAALFARLWETRDHREAERAYFERRAPVWEGR